jgi:hypothetical protein
MAPSDGRWEGGRVDGLCVHEVRHAVSRPTINGDIEVWPSCEQRLARDLYSLWGDGVLRAWNLDDQDHDFKLRHLLNPTD